MCFILATKDLTSDHIDILKEEWFINNDGAGVAYHDPEAKNTIRVRGFFTFPKLQRRLKKLLGKTCLVHLRNATHGACCEENCHPFLTCQETAFMAHNGILPAPFSSSKEHSDSAMMASLLSPISWEQLKRDRNEIGRVIGYNKLAFLNGAGEILIINSQLGTWLRRKHTWVSAAWIKQIWPECYQPRVKVAGKGVTFTPESDDEYYANLEKQVAGYVHGTSPRFLSSSTSVNGIAI